MTGRLPEFLGIGAIKASTTWLYENLFQHEQICLPVTKPLRYFDRHAGRSIDAYKAIFAGAGDRCCGEFSASYSVLPIDRIAYIHSIMPNLKLIFMMREPKARAWSDARMEFSVIRGLGNAPISTDAYCDFLRSEQCRERGDYLSILKRWQAYFDKSRFHIGLMDDTRDQPVQLLSDVFKFLGVSERVDFGRFPIDKKVFEGHSVVMPERCKDLLDEMYGAEQIEALGDFVGMDLLSRWRYV